MCMDMQAIVDYHDILTRYHFCRTFMILYLLLVRLGLQYTVVLFRQLGSVIDVVQISSAHETIWLLRLSMTVEPASATASLFYHRHLLYASWTTDDRGTVRVATLTTWTRLDWPKYSS